ncbi:MAG: DMT family transporter [Oscillospiraceae bacterium]|nr:DMT family transporter [Oscillospiraceae bacterium]
MKFKNMTAIFYAFAAAVFYALNAPCSKLLLEHIPPTFMAAFLYLGAGFGVGILYLFHHQKEPPEEKLTRPDLPYTIGMILLDIIAPILLMIGLHTGTSSNASLLGNFEIAATTCIAWILFREHVSKYLWTAVSLITISSMILSFEGIGSLKFSVGSLFVLGAAVCWGLENNCTRAISEKSAYQIVTIKGLCSGTGSLITALTAGETFPEIRYIFPALILGFVAYGLSIFTYIKAQKILGAAKTSAYYAAAPFIGAFLSFFILHEALSANYLTALLVMLAGTAFAVYDTFLCRHTHTFMHTHDGKTHVHTIEHTHFAGREHTHSLTELERWHFHA